MSHNMRWLLGVVLCGGALLAPSWADALPRMSLTAGTPCSACHVNIQGGGMRTDIGWGAMSRVGAITYDDIGLDSLHKQESNAWLDGRLAVGWDVRLQMAKLGRPQRDDETGVVTTPARRFIPMQIQPYLMVAPTDWLTLYGSYAMGPEIADGELCNPRYSGQACFDVEAIMHFSPLAPTLRAGFLQPSIGIRHDDHTMLIRGDASQPRSPIIAPNYAELGAELSYHPMAWLQAELGAFKADNLAKATAGDVSADDVAISGRMQLMPRSDELQLNSWLGASFYGAGDFLLQNYFLGLGRMNLATLMFEVSRSTRSALSAHETLNGMLHLSVMPADWIVIEGRAERATSRVSGQDSTTYSYVGGIQFFPVPYLEIRPEYRYLKTDDYILGQYTVQVHTFF
jgi:hypothetical protein